jgi:hypothetical protein
MNAETVKIIDPCRDVVATAQVIRQGNRFVGVVDLDSTPPGLREQFEEYEGIVNGQEFSLLDQIEEQIEAVGLTVVFEDGSVTAVEDLQVYPSTGRVSFKQVKESAPSGPRVRG